MHQRRSPLDRGMWALRQPLPCPSQPGRSRASATGGRRGLATSLLQRPLPNTPHASRASDGAVQAGAGARWTRQAARPARGWARRQPAGRQQGAARARHQPSARGSTDRQGRASAGMRHQLGRGSHLDRSTRASRRTSSHARPEGVRAVRKQRQTTASGPLPRQLTTRASQPAPSSSSHRYAGYRARGTSATSSGRHSPAALRAGGGGSCS